MFSEIFSMGIWGVDAYKVSIETNISTGMPCFDIVGLPDASVRESRERVRSAIKNSGFGFPVSRIIVNLAPANIKKEGSTFDLPILLAVMTASGEINFDLSSSVFVGELSLAGEIRPVNGALAMALAAKQNGFKSVYIPKAVASQAAAVEGIDVYGVESVSALIKHLSGEKPLKKEAPPVFTNETVADLLDFCDVAGQSFAKDAVETACAGGHNMLLIGPPGSGKSMIARRIPSILPTISFDEAIETTKIHSVAGELKASTPLLTSRPFRAPHHGISSPALVGGGSTPAPGEVSLAHNGVLFLDELPEFARTSMEAMRQPLEDGRVTISRVSGTVEYPCNIMLVAAMNPCPCGFYGHPVKKCTCSEQSVKKYLGKVSGPLLDRIDIQIEVPPVNYDQLRSQEKGEGSAEIKKRVDSVRKIQTERFKNDGIYCNADMTTPMLKKYCVLTDKANEYLKSGFEKMALSARAYDRILKVARTVADMASSELIDRPHIAAALRLRNLDNKYWNNL